MYSRCAHPSEGGSSEILHHYTSQSGDTIRGYASSETDVQAPIIHDRSDHTWTCTRSPHPVLGGIYLLKRTFRRYNDLAWWVGCSFEASLIGALRQELDGPRSTADVILDNGC